MMVFSALPRRTAADLTAGKLHFPPKLDLSAVFTALYETEKSTPLLKLAVPSWL